MKLIKSIALVISFGWITFLIAYGFKASITEMLILFTGLTATAFIFSGKGK